MSKFCANCGAQADDAAMVCGSCGTPFESAGADNTTPAAGVAPAASGLQKYIKPIIAAVAAILAIILCVTIFGGGAKKAAKKTMKAMIKGNEKTVAKMLSARYGDKDDRETYAKFLALDDDDVKVTFKVKGIEKVKKDDLKDIKEAVANGGVLDEKDVKKAVKVKIEVTAKDKDTGDKDTSTVRLIMTKEKGSWKLYDIKD